MIKFFRKIRQNLLNENKVGKYLLYAFGEIVLVIIGILIALYLNKQSEQIQTESKIDALFENVLLELEMDINISTSRIYFYHRKDSIASLVLNTDLTYDDYTGKNSSALRNLVFNRRPYGISNAAYNVLISNINNIPEKYSEAVRFLNTSHNIARPLVDEFNVFVKDLIDRNFTDLENNYDWFSNGLNANNKEAIDYFLNNYKYKNKVVRYRSAAFNFKNNIENYRYAASTSYKEIATILNKPYKNLDFIINDEMLEKYVGTYVNNLQPDQTIEILYISDGPYPQMKYKGPNGFTFGFLPLKLGKEFCVERIGIARFQDNEQGLQLTIYRGHEATKYVKVK